MSDERPTRRDVLKATAAAVVVPSALAGCEAADDVGLHDTAPDTDTGTGPDTDVDTDTVPPDDTAPAPPEPVTFDAASLAIDTVQFPSSVQAGAMTSTTAVVLTRVGYGREVLVRVWRETSTSGEVLLDVDTTFAVVDGYLRAELSGLTPGAEHRFGVFRTDSQGLPEARSLLGRFRTAPAPGDAPPLTVALASCMGSAAVGRNDAFGRIADHPDVDAILLLGDTVYADGDRTLEEYRSSWRGWMESEGYKAAFAHAGVYATWDDHEVDNNWDPEDVSADWRAAASRAFLENVAAVPGPGDALWTSYRWGDTAEIFVLDCRGERQPSTRGDTDIYVSPAQLDWLKAGLRDSPCRFKLVMNSVPITNMPNVWDLAADDRWEGYPRQRNELLQWIAGEDIGDVWFLSGDFHVCFVGKVQPGGAGVLGQTWEIACTCGNQNPLGYALIGSQFRYNTGAPRTTLVTFDPGTGAVRIRFVDPSNGQVIWDRELSQTN